MDVDRVSSFLADKVLKCGVFRSSVLAGNIMPGKMAFIFSGCYSLY